MRRITILMATYNDWLSVAHLLPEIDRVLEPLKADVRVVIVDDGSIDKSGCETIGDTDFTSISDIQTIELARNYGNQRANAIGVGYVANQIETDYLVVMDSDHEDRPEYIPALIDACQRSGNRKIIFAERTRRSEGTSFRIYYRIYQWLYRALTGEPISMGNYSVIPGPSIRRLANIAEIWNHYAAGIMHSRLPFEKIHTDRGVRRYGKSRMNLSRLILWAFSAISVYVDIMTVRILLASLWCAGALVLAGLVAMWFRIFTDVLVPGWTTIVLAIVGIMILQIVGTLCLMVFLGFSMRLQPLMIPYYEFQKFIFAIHHIYPRAFALAPADRAGAKASGDD